MNEIQDLEVSGGFVIPATLIREQIQWATQNRHASCYFQRFDVENADVGMGTVIAIVDLYDERWPTMSVTNDAEYVVERAVATQGDHPILYRDTEGQWDELRHREGHFACYRALDTRDFDEAIMKILALHEHDAAAHRTDN